MCRDCVHFRDYRHAIADRGTGQCAADPRRQRLDKNLRRHCGEYEASAPAGATEGADREA